MINLQWPAPLVWALILAMPTVLLIGLALPAGFVQKHRYAVSRVVTSCCLVNGAAAWGAALYVHLTKGYRGMGPADAFVLDTLAACGLLLTASLGAAVAVYSQRYMRADSRCGRFMQLIGAAIACVTLLPISSSLPVFLAAWMAAGFVLHPLLTFNNFGRVSHAAAWQKFAVSRLGDVCLLSALYLLEQNLSTVDFHGMQSAISGASHASVALPSFLIVLGACFKSAQFPFFSWLPDTLDAPTPVSALMHAGIINAGGLLLLRCSGLMTTCREASAAALICGLLTMAVACLALPCQTSVKRALAYSTVLQMGFMMVEIGLGAYAVAAVHLVGHALYKAHAFLRSSTLVEKNERGAATIGISIAAYAASGAIVLVTGFGIKGVETPAEMVFFLLLTIAGGSYLSHLWSPGISTGTLFTGAASVLALGAMYRAFSLGANHLFLHEAHAGSLSPYGSIALLGAAMLVGAIAPVISQLSKRLHPSIYAAAQSGFYFSSIFAAWLIPLENGKLGGYPAVRSAVTQKGGLWA